MNYLKQDQLEYGQWYWVKTISDSWIAAQYLDTHWSCSGEHAIGHPVPAIGPIKNPDQFKDVNLEQLTDDFWIKSGGWFNIKIPHAPDNAGILKHDLEVFVAAIAGQAIIDSGDPHLLQKMNDEIKMLWGEVETWKEFAREAWCNCNKLRSEHTRSKRELIEARSKITELTLANYAPPNQLSPNGFMLFGAWFKRVFKL